MASWSAYCADDDVDDADDADGDERVPYAVYVYSEFNRQISMIKNNVYCK